MTASNSTSPSIGWMGTGRMGYPLATRLLQAGFDVAVWNRTRAKAEPLAELGARIVDTPVDLADRDVVCSMLADSNAFTTSMLGEQGLLSDPARSPEVVCDSSTISIEASERVREATAERPTEILAAPVSGNPKAIESGNLGVVVSGDPGAYELARPILEAYGRSVSYVGDGERARLAKICHNLLLAILSEGLAEVTVLAERNGMARHQFLSFINESVVGSVFSRYKTPQFVGLDWTPTFTTNLLRKDLELGLEAAVSTDVPMPLVAETHQLLLRLIGEGHGEEDFAALLEMAARGAGMQLEPEDTVVADGLRSDAPEEG